MFNSASIYPPGVFIKEYRPFTDQGRIILGVRRKKPDQNMRYMIYMRKIMEDAKVRTPPNSKRNIIHYPVAKSTS